MTPAQLLDVFRALVRDEAEPYLWPDAEVFAYMDDAQTMFCRLVGGIPDSRSPLCWVPYQAGDETVLYDRRILKIRRVERDDKRPVCVINDEDLQFRSAPRSGRGELCQVVAGDDQNTLRLIDAPAFNGMLHLHVLRLPLNEIVDETSELEIDRIHHLHLRDWMAALAYNKQDAETYDKTKALEFEARFRQYCDQVKWEQERREHKPRLVSYGGI